MPWCVIHRITGVPPSVSVVLKIALRSLDGITVTLVYSRVSLALLYLRENGDYSLSSFTKSLGVVID